MLEKKNCSSGFFFKGYQREGHKPSNSKVHVPMCLCGSANIGNSRQQKEIDWRGSETQTHCARNLGFNFPGFIFIFIYLFKTLLFFNPTFARFYLILILIFATVF